MPIFGQPSQSKYNYLKNNNFSDKSLLLAVLAASVAISAGNAYGKGGFANTQRSLSTRVNPAYEPQGLRAGDYILHSSITNGLVYNDNIYATEQDRKHDWLYRVNPEFSVRSDFIRHQFDAGFSFERGLYRDISEENYSDYTGFLNGRIDLTGQTNIPLTLSYTRQHVRRGAPDERRALSPTFYQLWDGTMGLVHEGQRLALKVIAGLKRMIFDNTVGSLGTIDNGDRDRSEYTLNTTFGFSPDMVFAPFLYSNLLMVDYDRAFDNNGLNRDSTQYEAGVGTIVNFSDITSATFTIGRLHRSPDDPTLDDINDFTYGVDLKWEPSTLATFRLSGDRSVQESTLPGVSNSVSSSLRLAMDYELFPNLIVSPSAGISEKDYKGTAGGRSVTKDGELKFSYKMNQNLWIDASYQYTKQKEKEAAPDLESYKNNIYGVSLKLQF